MRAVKVKICGLTRPADVEVVLASGADAIGVVFAESPRRVTADKAVELLAGVPREVKKVGLFMRQERSEIMAILRRVPLDLLQFHGPADNDFCRSFGLPFLKAIGVATDRAVEDAKRYPDAAGILFDSAAADGAGGTGQTFDWSFLCAIEQAMWLAGGLNPGNVAEAVERVRPDWVDVSSGVEDAPGVKNAARIRAFVRAAKLVAL